MAETWKDRKAKKAATTTAKASSSAPPATPKAVKRRDPWLTDEERQAELKARGSWIPRRPRWLQRDRV